MNKKEIKLAILKVAGNPESGPIAELADAFAVEIEKLANPAPVEAKSFAPEKETRLKSASETR